MFLFTTLLICSFGLLPAAFGGAPPLLNFQGRIVIGGVSYNGTGQFQFALVDGGGTNTYWSNDGASVVGEEPTAAITLTLTNGLYAVLLGNTNVAGMTQPLSPSAFTNADVRLRVWFNDGVHGFERLTPDQQIVSAGYAMVADTANNFSGTISNAQLPGNLATTNYVIAATNNLVIPSTNGFVGASITNGLATTNYVIAATNTLGSAAYSSATAFVPNTAAGIYAAGGDTNKPTAYQPSNANLTNLATLNAVGLTNYQGTNLANGGSSAGQILTATTSGVT